jgi:Flp pilus assembly protein TadG
MRATASKAARGQSTVEFAMLASFLLLLVLGIFDLGRAVVAYIGIAEAAHEGARQLVLLSNAASTPPDTLIVNATLAKIGGGGMVLTEDPCLPGCATPASATVPTTPNTGYIWITPGSPPYGVRKAGNQEMTVKITYLFAPMTGLISQITGATITLTASSSMRAEY